MKDIPVLCPKQYLEGVPVVGRLILQVDAAECLGLLASSLALLGLGHDLEDAVAPPVVVEDFVLREEEAVLAHGVHIHLLDRLALQDVLVNFHYLGVPIVLHRLEGRLPQ